MKKLITIIICAIFFNSANAQLMFIHKTNHSIESIYTADIDSIVFSSDSTTCPIVFDYDGNKYKTVLIGNQCWMAENLKTTHYSDGTPLVNGDMIGDISGNPTAAYFWNYDGIQAYTKIYGLLYTWAATMNGAASSNAVPSGVQGVCPADWHLPSMAEWDTLATYINNDNGGTYVKTSTANNGYEWDSIGGHMKSTLLWGVSWPQDGTDSYGFWGIPSGYRGMLGNNDDLHVFCNFWTSTNSNVFQNAYQIRLRSQDGKFIKMNYIYNNGYSIRCVKD